MSSKWILKATLKTGNVALLAFVLIFSYLYFFLPFLLVGFAGYIFFVLQTLKNEEFQKEISMKETIQRIKKSGKECSGLYEELRRYLGRSLDLRVQLILAEKEGLVKEFLQDKENALKQKIVRRSLELIKVYIKLMANFSIRCGELIEVDVNKIKDRINANNCRRVYLEGSDDTFDLRKAIEMDQRLLESVDEEKCELERISSRLDYMESTIRMLKRRMLTSGCHEGVFEDIENIVNEAAALDNVLNRPRNSGLRT